MSGDDAERVAAQASISQRKREHLDAALSLPDRRAGGWDDIALVHEALPGIDLAEVDLSTQLLGRHLALPLVIPGMTGGHADAVQINAALAGAAEAHGVAIGVGSQRAALRHPELIDAYAVVRKAAPNALVIGNIGISQLVAQDDAPALGPRDVAALVEMVGADALAVHLNFVEELVQPEGQARARGADEALAALVETCPVPVVAKETGAGLSRATAVRLAACGVVALDVGGLGGTSFAAIEAVRAEAVGDRRGAALGEALAAWGIPTPVSVAACAPVLPTIAVGGIRSGVDAAKAIALGARAVGVGRPLLERALVGDGALGEWIADFSWQLRAAVFLSGCRDLAGLAGAPRIVRGETAVWLKSLTWA